MKKIMLGLVIVMLSVNVFAAKMVQIKGSDTMVNLGQSVAEEFMKSNKKVKIAVTGGGSGTGIAAIINKTVDIAQSSRAIAAKEIDAAKKNGVEPKEWIVGYDGIAVIVNKNLGIDGLTSDQVRAIYLAEVKNWKEVGGPDKPIVLLSRDSNSGTHVYFKEHILRKGNAKGPEEYVASTLFMPSTQAIVSEVGKNDSAVGYIGLGYLDAPNIKGLKIDGITVNVENVKNKTYPISRGLFWYTDGEAKGDIKKIIDFVYGEEGQKVVAREGFVPIK